MEDVDRYIWDVKSEHKRPRGVSVNSQYYKRYDSRIKWTYIDTIDGRLNMDGFISVNDYLFREYFCRIGDIVLIDDVRYTLINISTHSINYVVVVHFTTCITYMKEIKKLKSLTKERNNTINDILNDI